MKNSALIARNRANAAHSRHYPTCAIKRMAFSHSLNRGKASLDLKP